MLLLCDETNRHIEYGEPLRAGTRGDVDRFGALCAEVIKRIPLDLRSVVFIKRRRPRQLRRGLLVYSCHATAPVLRKRQPSQCPKAFRLAGRSSGLERHPRQDRGAWSQLS